MGLIKGLDTTRQREESNPTKLKKVKITEKYAFLCDKLDGLIIQKLFLCILPTCLISIVNSQSFKELG